MKGEMRKLWPAIHQKLTECNWTARDMVKWLEERGASMSVELFRVYLRDLDREQGYDRSKNEFHGTSKNKRFGDSPISDSPRAPIKPVVAEKTNQVVQPVAKSSGKRKSILKQDKGMFGDLDPQPADGVVDLKQK